MVTISNQIIVEIDKPDYVPVIKDRITSYGGSQMWFSSDHRFRRDYVLHHNGCGTIATADLFLYLTLQNADYRNPDTDIALVEDKITYANYDLYVRHIDHKYTKTKRILAVLGPTIASSVNTYSKKYGLNYRAKWCYGLTYYDMLELIENMLFHDIPVILSIGPNTPNLWGSKGITFYHRTNIMKKLNQMLLEADKLEDDKYDTDEPLYVYKAVSNNVHGHYVTVTGLIYDEETTKTMLRISSWGKQYYIDYEEYREYVEHISDPFTSSLVSIT